MNTALLAEDELVAELRLGGASHRENFRYSTPERVHVRKLRFAEVYLLQTKEMLRMASSNVNGRLRMRTGTEHGDASAKKGNQGQPYMDMSIPFSATILRSAGGASSLFASLRPLGRRAEKSRGLDPPPSPLLSCSPLGKMAKKKWTLPLGLRSVGDAEVDVPIVSD
jgi:hypothetical protein